MGLAHSDDEVVVAQGAACERATDVTSRAEDLREVRTA